MPRTKKQYSEAEHTFCEKTLNALPLAIVVFDNKKVYFVNTRALAILKLPKKTKVEELDVYNFILPEYHKIIRHSNNKILKGMEFAPVELKIKDKKGSILDIEVKSNAIVFNGKKVVQSIFQDISDRKELNKELSEARHILDLFGKNNTDIITKYEVAPKEGYSYISSTIEEVLGYPVKEFLKDKYLYMKLIHPDDIKKLPPDQKEFLALIEKNNNLVIRFFHKNGSMVWLNSKYSLVKNEKGEVVSILTISRDITQLKEKEEELKQKWGSYESLLVESPSAFFIHRKGICLMCNKEAARILEAGSPEKLKGKYLIDFIIAPQRERALGRLKDAIEGKESDFLDYKIINLKGKEVEVELKSVLVNFEGEKSVLTIMNDISAKTVYAKEKLRAEIAEEHNKSLIREIELRNKIQEKLIENEKKLINQTAKLSAIFENSTHLVWTVDKDKNLTSYNKNFYDVLLSKYNVKVFANEPVHEILPKQVREEYVEYWYPLYDRVLAGEKLKFVKPETDASGNDVFREVFINPIYNENNEVVEVSCMAHDITENKRNEKQIIEKTSKIRAIFESGTHIIWTVNRQKAYTSFNNNFYKAIYDIYGKYPELNKEMTRTDNQYASEEYHNFWHGKYEEAFQGKAVEFITERSLLTGNKIFRQIFLYPIYDENNEVVEVSGMGFDITDKIINEQKITSQAAKLNAIFEGSSHYIWTVDCGGNLISFNKNYRQLINRVYGVEPHIGLPVNRGKMISNEEYNSWWNDQYERTFKGSPQNFETAINDINNNKVYLDVFLNPIYENNTVIEVSGIAHDVTEKKLNEERITQSLKEKEILLKEVHHRVKNNMQVISSILNLQSSYVKDEYALGLLKESQNRIKTMAYIHESLYQNKTFTSINFSDYVSTLTNNILQSYAAAIQKVRLVLDIQKIILNLDTSIPAGLIINELVTNSIKHAFKGDKDGIILINLHSKDNTLFLEVSDNGQGFPDEVDFKNTNSLGLQLVNTLVEQLNGSIELTKNKYKGTSFHIHFPM
jgi:PAS domain S-box-containing protein